MASIELTPSQRSILSALINLHGSNGGAVKGEQIAAEVDRNPGTIRNQMQSLKALQLVEGVPGPKGGYKPTAAAFDALEIQEIDEPAEVPVVHNGERLEAVNVMQVDLTSVHHPDNCRAEVQLRGSIRGIDEGDAVEIGPTPKAKLVIAGTVVGIDELHDTLILSIDGMRAPAD